MVLDSIYPDDIKIIFNLVIKKNESSKSFLLGRSRSCDIKLNVDSISRNHAAIKYESGSFFLSDTMSTFGTMILLRQPLMFTRRGKEEAAIQSGPTLIEIKHGGPRKIELTYTTKAGKEKKCAVYSDFKHKIPSEMRNFIDKNTEQLEVIRVEELQLNKKKKSIKDTDEKTELSRIKHNFSQIISPLDKHDCTALVSERVAQETLIRRDITNGKTQEEQSEPVLSKEPSKNIPLSNLPNLIRPQAMPHNLEELKELDGEVQNLLDDPPEEDSSEISKSVEDAWRMVSANG
eukprot:CAMPEP_0197019436 /NCGR_PEP_ID=MMETSP1380-20130617/80699_1 /TAXON_ID=5936 /ORGANISM="Euplotes crassus, Strain CT5" /LENGTH=289 /DNA_ID=CAMNT_0042446857 /DNA_START=957 /DNA_END=1822 /DNA_ORIENTATION=-